MALKYLPRDNPETFEINTAAWLFELSRRSGKRLALGNVPSREWDKLKEQGMDFVWLMGVWNRSQEGRKVSLGDQEREGFFNAVLPECTPEDIIGSCYSISSYEPDPLVGTWEDIDKAHEDLNQRGMGLILDFVPNHTGIDHHWIIESPEYYIQGTEQDYRKDKNAFFPIIANNKTLYIAHGRDPNFSPWTDTAQLNYFNPETHKAMLEKVEKISQHCDGVRCDMAMLVLRDVFQKTWGWANQNPTFKMPDEEFWKAVTQRFPNLVWISEAYWDTEWTLQQLGFDYVYDKRLYDRLRWATPHEVYLHLTADIAYQNKLLRFIENHDEARSIMAFGKEKAQAAATLFGGLPGMKLFFQGQFEGNQIHLPIQIRQSKPDNVDKDIRAFYDKLLPALNEEIFHTGTWQLKEVFPDGDDTQDNLIAYIWKQDRRLMLVIVNLSRGPALGRVSFQDDVSERHDYSFVDRLTGENFSRSGKLMAHPGLRFQLKGYQAQLFEITPEARI